MDLVTLALNLSHVLGTYVALSALAIAIQYGSAAPTTVGTGVPACRSVETVTLAPASRAHRFT